MIYFAPLLITSICRSLLYCSPVYVVTIIAAVGSAKSCFYIDNMIALNNLLSKRSLAYWKNKMQYSKHPHIDYDLIKVGLNLKMAV